MVVIGGLTMFNAVNEKKFYDALENIFIGAKIEGDSGYINLLNIKSAYYHLILKEFKEDVKGECIISGNFKEEFFDKLYSFFEKYFSESGSVYFVKTANGQRVYERIYTDNKDVMLFWKTHMLYYVKSDILFQSMNVDVDSYYFYFNVGTLANKQNNEKKEIVFDYKDIQEIENKKQFVFEVAYSQNGAKTKVEDIAKKLKINEEVLEKAFKTFKKQSEVDFFINKDADKFLNEQLDIYMYQILLDSESKFEQGRLEQLKVIKVFARRIIDFIAQFEDELVYIWNKPKFVLNSNYVVTMDRLPKNLIDKIKRHKNYGEQVKEWKDLRIPEVSDKLPIDTKYFKDLEIEILNLFDNLDEVLNGRLIHSDNYQALNTLQKRYKEKIQCIYIDPPFNLAQNAKFPYKVNYKEANWATILENRLKIAKKFLNDKGSIFVRCDYNGNFIVRCLLDIIFEKDNFKNEIILSKSNRIKNKGTKLLSWHDTLFYYAKNKEQNFFKHITNSRGEEQWRQMDNDGEQWSIIPNEIIEKLSPSNVKYNKEGNATSRARIILEKEFLPPNGRRYPSQEKIWELENNGMIKLNSNGNPVMLKPDDIPCTDNWTDFSGYSSNWKFETENSEKLIYRLIDMTSQNNNDIIFDFFAGSTTTQAVAQKLGRKWLGIEMGEQFYNVDLPRLKSVISGEKSGISKDINWQGGGFFKYYDLEQYEDVLRKMKYENSTPTDFWNAKEHFATYIFKADQKFAEVLKIKNGEIDVDFGKLYENIDFAETISLLKGLPIKKISKTGVLLEGESEEIKTNCKEMSNEEKLDFVRLLKPLLWWGKE
jgi:adenine specific DNA methylase Mod